MIKHLKLLKNVCNVLHCKEVQILERNKRNKYLRIIKENGLSTRQIARLTGISRGTILKI